MKAPTPDSSLDTAYRRIYEWYRSNHKLLLQDEIRDFPTKGRTTKLSPDNRKQSIELINRMPDPEKASDEDRRFYLHEVVSKGLEWGYTAQNGDKSNGQIAAEALDTGAKETANEPPTSSAATPGKSSSDPEQDSPSSHDQPSDVEDAIPWTPTQWSLSRGARDILTVAGVAAERSRAKLSTTLLLISMAELSRPVRDPQWAADFLFSELQIRWPQFLDMRSRYLGERKIEIDRNPSAQSPIVQSSTKSVAALMERAQDIAVRTTGNKQICGRHLLGAFFARSRSEAWGHALGRLEEIGIELDLVAAHLFKWVRDYGDDDEAWRLLLIGETSEITPLAGFKSDDPSGRDQLGITPDVNALATLIAARTVSPPLSIGLFGDWGSGKTFFMRQLRAAVGERSARARQTGKMQRELDFYKHIVQIDFNAWHYVEGNLWASLVEHILDNLVAPDCSDRKTALQQMQQHWIDRLGFTENALVTADGQTKTANEKVNQAQAAVDDAKQEHEKKTQQLEELSKKNVGRDFLLSGAGDIIRDALVPLGLKPVSDAVNDLQASLREAQSTIEHGNVVLTPLLKARDRSARWRSLLTILLAPPIVSTGVCLLVTSSQGRLATIGTAVTGVVGGLATWIKRQAQWASDRLQSIEDAQRKFDEALAKELAATAAEIARTQQELAVARQDLAAAQAKADEARRGVQDAKQALAEATPTRLLGRYVADRAASTDYRKHLGVLAVVRDDFQTLSDLIEADNWRLSPDGTDDAAHIRRGEAKVTSEAQEKADEATRINRIVLYIDDLDRCPPAKVVDVLQAVHLLLAFPLFVVVVGVDARWIARSLETKYRELLRADGANPADDLARVFGTARSEDYLEKIFQIPLWLRAMEPGDVRRMVRGLVSASETTQGGAATAPAPQAPVAGTPAQPTASTSATGTDASGQPTTGAMPSSVAATAGQPGSPAPAAGPETTPVQNVESLQVNDYEHSVMDELAPLLGRSPRALKRFINVYRLVKARLTPTELSAFLRRRDDGLGDFEIALFLLAVDSGLPRISASVAHAVATEARQPGGAIEPPAESSTDAKDDWARLMHWLDEHGPGARFAHSLSRPIEWVHQVSRFSFQTEEHGDIDTFAEDAADPSEPRRRAGRVRKRA